MQFACLSLNNGHSNGGGPRSKEEDLFLRSEPPPCDFYAFAHVSSIEEARSNIMKHHQAIFELLTGQRHKGILVLYVCPGE